MLHTSNDIRNPGLRTLPPGVERYFVRGGGLSIIEVLPEDKIEIINEEGRQICEIIVFNSKGKSDLSILNLKENAKQPEKLLINGLSMFLSQTEKFEVKVVNKDIVLFKAFDEGKNYSESGIINRKSGELVHEITIGIKSDNLEKNISFYLCS
ncbi:hypothetical protein N9607_01270 [Candidatus Pelagibacter sp.]|nr:hypothetical protein [Candidatus Pelagibacter sp.]